jgi:pimeloyl-ACP methyl ester carboxylesterase
MKESSVSMPEVPGVTHRFIDADGVRLHIAEAGDSTKQPVLLLHGFPQHWYVWRHGSASSSACGIRSASTASSPST